jgi:hypothetical protein
MAEPITKLEDLSAAQRRVIEANAGNELIPVKRDASGVITEYRQMSPQEYLTSKGGLTRAGYFGNDIGMSDEEYFGLLKQGGVELLNETKNARVREGENQKLLARYKAQGMSDAQAKQELEKFWQEAAEAEKRGYYIDENGNQIPFYGAGGGWGGPTDSSGNPIYPQASGLRSSASGRSMAMGTDPMRAERQSAYDLLYSQFKQYGLEALVEPLKGLIVSGASPAEFTIKLRESEPYKKRFAANAARIQKGLTAISEAEYLGLEDQYQNIMRNYGLPAEYYTRGDMGTQEGFNKFIANDVSAAELEDRVMTAQSRVMNANPEVLASLKQFYPGITNGDILAYTLDPEKALTDIKRKVTAAEIGGSAMQAGLGISGARAEELTAAGITKQQAQQGFQTVAEVAPRGGVLSEIYKQSPYTQTTAEAEVFGLAGSTEAAKQRKKLTSLETAAFGGSAGAGAIARDRAGVL